MNLWTNLPSSALSLGFALVLVGCGGSVMDDSGGDAGAMADGSSAGGDGSSHDDRQPACHSSADCPSGFEAANTCYGPIVSPQCVVAVEPACTTDADCDGGKLCQPVTAPATSGGAADGQSACAMSCTYDLDCAPTQACASDGHCQPRSCSQCPSYFSCTSDTCTIPACTTDAQCPGGYCVNGACGPSLGVCQPACG